MKEGCSRWRRKEEYFPQCREGRQTALPLSDVGSCRLGEAAKVMFIHGHKLLGGSAGVESRTDPVTGRINSSLRRAQVTPLPSLSGNEKPTEANLPCPCIAPPFPASSLRLVPLFPALFHFPSAPPCLPLLPVLYLPSVPPRPSLRLFPLSALPFLTSLHPHLAPPSPFPIPLFPDLPFLPSA